MYNLEILTLIIVYLAMAEKIDFSNLKIHQIVLIIIIIFLFYLEFDKNIEDFTLSELPVHPTTIEVEGESGKEYVRITAANSNIFNNKLINVDQDVNINLSNFDPDFIMFIYQTGGSDNDRKKINVTYTGGHTKEIYMTKNKVNIFSYLKFDKNPPTFEISVAPKENENINDLLTADLSEINNGNAEKYNDDDSNNILRLKTSKSINIRLDNYASLFSLKVMYKKKSNIENNAFITIGQNDLIKKISLSNNNLKIDENVKNIRMSSGNIYNIMYDPVTFNIQS